MEPTSREAEGSVVGVDGCTTWEEFEDKEIEQFEAKEKERVLRSSSEDNIV